MPWIKKIRRIESSGMDAAKDQFETDTYDSKVQTFNPQGKGGTPTTYAAGGKNYQNKDKAQANVKTDVNSVMDNYLETTAPKIAEEYMAQGNVEKAEAWNGYIQGKRGQNAVKDWSKGYMALSSGDWDGGAKAFGDYYTEYVDDGVDFVGHELVKSEDGTVTGFNLTLHDKDTGKDSTIPMTTADMIKMGTAANPAALFEMAATQEAEANSMRAKTAAEIAKEQREKNTKIELKGIDQEYDIQSEDRAFDQEVDLTNLKHKQNLERDANKATTGGGGNGTPADVQTAEWMVANNVAPDKEAAWQLIQLKSRTTPIEFARSYAEMEAANVSSYSKDKKSTEQLIDEGIALYNRLHSNPNKVNPAASGLPQWSPDMLESEPNI